MHVFLVGLPGAGKSTVGEAVAKELSVRFVDLDHDIEVSAGRSIASIFRDEGEPRFRELEAEATARLPCTPAIVAPGGGWTSNDAARGLVPQASHAIYLRVDPSTAASRLGAAAGDRPLLARDPQAALERLLLARRGAYEAADAVVDTEDVPIDQVIKRTAELASAFLQHRLK